MSSTEYVSRKMYRAVYCLCGEGSFKERLRDVTISVLTQLGDDDLEGELGENLSYILDWTKRNMKEGFIQREPNEIERRKLIEKMLDVLIKTSGK